MGSFPVTSIDPGIEQLGSSFPFVFMLIIAVCKPPDLYNYYKGVAI